MPRIMATNLRTNDLCTPRRMGSRRTPLASREITSDSAKTVQVLVMGTSSELESVSLPRSSSATPRRAAVFSRNRPVPAAQLLREEFGATRVIAFGSLAHGAWFEPRSDIDLAVEGVPVEAFWRAWCALDRLGSTVEIDLVAIESAPERLRDEIAQQGVAL